MSTERSPKNKPTTIEDWRKDPEFSENWATNGKLRTLKYNTGRHPGGYRSGYEGVYSVRDMTKVSDAEFGIKIKTLYETFFDRYTEPPGLARKGQTLKLNGWPVSGNQAFRFMNWKKKMGLLK